MRKKDEQLRVRLLGIARELAEGEGVKNVQIRRLAQAAGIAVGTVYHYFADKNELLLALTEEYWRGSLNGLREQPSGESFLSRLEQAYLLFSGRMQGPAGFLMSSLGDLAGTGRERMLFAQRALEALLVEWLAQDHGIRKEVWTEVFTKECFAAFAVIHLVEALRRREQNIDFLLEIIRRVLYGNDTAVKKS